MSHRSTSRLRKIIVATAASAASALLLTLSPTTASATTDCSGSCMTNLEMQRSGLSTAFTFDTSVPTKDAIRIYKEGTLVATGLNSTYRSHHVLSSPGTLTPNTAYTSHLTVTDRAGNTLERSGNVTTKHRRVDVLFNTIAVTNDSDSSSAGEFKTRFKAGTTTAASWMVPQSISSGSTVQATQMLSMKDAGKTTKVLTEMYDNDYTNPLLPFGEDWTFYSSHPAWTSGYSPVADWSTAATTLDTLVETTTFKPFQMQVNQSVGFVVRGQYMVSYY